MCLDAALVNYCVMMHVGVCVVMCLNVCLMCLHVAVVAYCAMLYCMLLCVLWFCVSVPLCVPNVRACVVCGLLCGVVWFLRCCVCVFV